MYLCVLIACEFIKPLLKKTKRNPQEAKKEKK